jgi:hypothetical protein
MQDIITALKDDFEYTIDNPERLDPWFIMKKVDGKYRGDCDDFALTAIWHICKKNIFLFILNFMILNRYHIWYAKIGNDGHAVAYAKGKFFENRYARLMSRQELKENDIRLIAPLFFPFIALKLIIGLFYKIIKNR